jgi:hypothetical protein
MPIVKRILTKNNISADNGDVFQLSAEQKQHIKTNYIDTGKIISIATGVGGPLTGTEIESNKLIQTTEFVDAAAFKEYVNDPQIIAIRQSANAFYANRNIGVTREPDFSDVEFGSNPPAQ